MTTMEPSHNNNDDDHLKVNDKTLTKSEQDALLRSVLPSLNGQEGSPTNTFTSSELQELQKAVGCISVGPSRTSTTHAKNNKSSSGSGGGGGNHVRKNSWMDIRDVQSSFQPSTTTTTTVTPTIMPCSQDGMVVDEEDILMMEQNKPTQVPLSLSSPLPNNNNYTAATASALDWHGVPRFHQDAHLARSFREQVRYGQFQGPTNGICPGFLQCNLVVLPQGPVAYDFLLFCQRNPKACPLIEVCDVGSPYPSGVAPTADLRTDIPKYAIYRNGQLEQEVTDVTSYWPEQSVAFLIGCSFSYDGALMDAGIPLKSAQQKKNVPMYMTNLKCRPAGCLHGNMVVSMKPIPALQVSKHVEITSKYTHAHGGPIAIGSASAIGIVDMYTPQWGEPIEVAHDEVPVFHACGVTPQSILMESKVPFAITHSAGHMFVTDLPSDMGV